MSRITRRNPAASIADAGVSIGKVLTVKPDGTGDFTTPKLANDAIAVLFPSASNRFTIKVYPGTYTDIEWTVQPYTTWIACGRAGEVWLQGAQPDSTSDANSTNNSTIHLGGTTTLIGFKITAKNMRYPIHDEQNGLNPDATHVIKNCHIEHYGNQGIVDYRVANSLPAGSPWLFASGWGQGTASNCVTQLINCTIKSASYYPFVLHNNVSFDQPAESTLEKCRLIGPANLAEAIVLGLGSGREDRVTFTDCEFSGGQYILEADDPWSRVDLAGQYANHSDYSYRCARSVVGFQTNNRGKALKITSASTGATSTVRVSGTAATAVFGSNWSYKDGGGGVKGYAWGDLDISGILVGVLDNTTVNNTLGKRLGDCSTTSKTLTVTVDGGSPVNVVFNTNLTAVSNATIISTINTALGAAATAAEYLVSQGERYPHFIDRQATLINGDTVGIPQWSAVKLVAGKVKLLAVTDPAEVLYGIAVEQIAPGATGRVLREGLLLSAQLSGGPTVTEGTPVYLSDSTAGALSTSGSRVFGVGSTNGFCYFRGGRVLTGAPTPWVASNAYAAYERVILPTGGIGYLTTAGTSRPSWDATERALWTFLPGGHQETFTASGTWVAPLGISRILTLDLLGAGDGGGGGGSATAAIAQVGGAGGSAGERVVKRNLTVTPGASYTVTVGAAGTAGTGGAAGGNNPGTVGSGGGNTSLVIGGTTHIAHGGAPGSAAAGNSTATVASGSPGGSGGLGWVSSFAVPGSGGVAHTAFGLPAVPLAGVVGGAAGGPANSSTSKGGLGGAARTSVDGLVGYTAAGGSATASGGNGTAATQPGCGGGGGGGGCAGGSGGNGAAGYRGELSIEF